ncbi:hypothetical protein D3C78_1420910 [compost metagenome]
MVVVLAAQLRQARALDQLLDLRGAGLLLGLLLLLAVQLLVARGLLGHGLQGGLFLRIVDFDLVLLLQALLFLLLLAGLLGLLFIDQTGFQQLVAEGKAHKAFNLDS